MTQVAPAAAMSAGAHPALGLPHYHTVEKALSLPVVEAAVSQASHLYSAVKGTHPLVSWALITAERTAVIAAATATPLMAPLAAPLAAADVKLAAQLTALEEKVPIVKERPEAMYAAAKEIITRTLQPRIHQVYEVRQSASRAALSLRELSWRAANDVLATGTGRRAVSGVDGGAAAARRLLDYYLPPAPEHQQPEIVSATEDPALHTVQTVSRLSLAAIERIYAVTLHKIQELRGVHDPARYVAALLSVLHLTRLLRPDLVQTDQSAKTPQSRQIDQSGQVAQSGSDQSERIDESQIEETQVVPQSTQRYKRQNKKHSH